MTADVKQNSDEKINDSTRSQNASLSKNKTKSRHTSHKELKRDTAKEDSTFARALREDDDGYDPWSDRHSRPEVLFQADPWQ